jgi:hypothetical protein
MRALNSTEVMSPKEFMAIFQPFWPALWASILARLAAKIALHRARAEQ